MKQTVMAILLVVLCAGEALAFGEGFVGLYTNANRDNYSVSYSGSMTQFETWVWAFTPEVGVSAADFRLAYPPNVLLGSLTANPLIASSEGDITSGISVAFGSCQQGWVWTHHQICFLMSSMIDLVRIQERGTALPYGLQFASCEAGSPHYRFIVYNDIYLNFEPISTESSSWGAIKSLF